MFRRAALALLRRAVLVLGFYVVTLLVATHWPGIAISGPVPRPDLWIHAAAYATLTLLVIAAWHQKRPLSRAALRWLIVGVMAFAAVDEITQPLFRRTAAIEDWAADGVGAMLAGLATYVMMQARRAPSPVQGPIFTATGVAGPVSASLEPEPSDAMHTPGR